MFYPSLNDHFSLPRIFLRINFETPIPYSTFLIVRQRSISSFILDLFLPKFHHFPSDYFYESISRQSNPLSIPFPSLFHHVLSRNKVYIYTHTHKHTRDLTDPMVHDPSICIKRGHTRFQEYRGKIPFREMHRVVANNAEGMRVPVHLSVPVRRNFNV